MPDIVTYSEFKDLDASSKILLCKMNASFRLTGWESALGDVYKLRNVEDSVFVKIAELSTIYTEVSNVVGLMPMQYYYDRSNATIYLRTTDSLNPNSVFLHAEVSLFFSNRPVALPYDLESGYVVDWLPFIEKSSGFQFAIDNKETQVGSPIESKSTLSMVNDGNYFVERYDRLYFENKPVRLYSYNLGLAPSQAQLLFRGTVQGKSYSNEQVTFQLKDPLNELRSPLPQDNYQDFEYTHSSYGASTPARMNPSNILRKQRNVYGFVNGVKLNSVDDNLEAGNVAPDLFNMTATGLGHPKSSGSSQITYLIEGDGVEFSSQEGVRYEIADVTGGITLTQAYTGPTQNNVEMRIFPQDNDGRWNRHFHLHGHNPSMPQSTVAGFISVDLIQLTDASFLRVGDVVEFVNGGAIADYFRAEILEIIGGILIRLSVGISYVPSVGSVVRRSPIRALYIGNFKADPRYYYIEDNSVVTLKRDNLSPEIVSSYSGKAVTGTSITFASNVVNGVGTLFENEFEPGDYIRVTTSTNFYSQVLSVLSNTQLRVVSALAGAEAPVFKKVIDTWASEDVVSVDIYGKPLDNVQTNSQMERAPSVVRDLLETAGLAGDINGVSFDEAELRSPHRIGLVVPDFGADESQDLREITNRVNRSVLGVLFQDSSFQYNYDIIQPRQSSVTAFSKYDSLSYQIDSDASDVVSSVVLRYKVKELDFMSAESSSEKRTAVNESAVYLLGSLNELELDTLLVDENSARIFASRWAFLLSSARSLVTITTKLKAQTLNINDRVSFEHPRIYKRVGSELQKKVGLLSNIRRGANGVVFEFDDLASAFSKVAIISASDALSFSESTEEDRFSVGYITDPNGLIDNDNFGINLIW